MNRTATITRIVTRTAYARNGNAHNPTKYYAWAIAVDGKSEGQAATLAKAKAILRDDYGVTEFEIVRPDAAAPVTPDAYIADVKASVAELAAKVAADPADAAEDAREAAMHREYQEGWDAFYERSGAVCPYAGGVCAKAWDEGYMAAARNARENRAMGL